MRYINLSLLAAVFAALPAQPAADPYHTLSESVVRLWHYSETTGHPEPLDSVGTGFFVAHQDALYLVSAGHMSRTGDLMARVPLANGSQQDLIIPRAAWIHHPMALAASQAAKAPDVAVARVTLPEGWQPQALKLGTEQDPEPMDSIVVAGYPATLAAAPVQRPLLRKGIVAMKGDAPYLRYAGENTMADARVRVLDVLTLPGNSGSPVFAAESFPAKTILVGMVTAGEQDLAIAYSEPLSRIREAIGHAQKNLNKDTATWSNRR
ncbi:MAG: trypsin-like peptidase domain-containing protein [Acidobacteria bacterium]|nr:trypsin-like peptidase domain-containing protein [Acidobacteriota bacterium]